MAMSQATVDAIREILRERGPLGTKEIVAELTARNQLSSRNPEVYVRNALSYNRTIVLVGSGRTRTYVHLPSFACGAAMRLPLPAEPLEGGRAVVSSEVLPFLWPDGEKQRLVPAKVALDDGPTIRATLGGGGLAYLAAFPYHYAVIGLPTEFWDWWRHRSAAGADALEIRCEDGEHGRYTARACVRAELDIDAVLAANEALIAAAATAAADKHGVEWRDVARRVIGSGIYHRDVPPDPLTEALFDPPGRFILGDSRITYREDLTPAMARVLARRGLVPGSKNDWVLKMVLPPDGESLDDEEIELEDELDGEDAIDALMASGDLFWGSELGTRVPSAKSERVPFAQRPSPGESGYRVTVSLDWMPKVWRAIEILGSQTLEHLHDAIQLAFGWDNDHLWEFNLSGERSDPFTRISMQKGFMNPDYDPPTADEVTIGELEPRPGQRLYYLFDFGDNLGHRIKVDGSFVADAGTEYPQIVEVHGDAPQQYPTYDDEGWEDADDDEGMEEDADG